MRIRGLTPLIAFVLVPFALSQGDTVSKSVLKSIQADYDHMSTAFAKNDISVFEALIAEDYVLTSTQGKDWNREKTLADFKRQMGNMKNAKWTRHITKAHKEGDLVVVEVAGTFHGSFPGQGGKVSVFDLKSWAVDSWDVSQPAHKLRKSKILKLDAKVDGKKMG